MKNVQVWLLAKKFQFSIWEILSTKIGSMQSFDDWEEIKYKQLEWVDISDNYDGYLCYYTMASARRRWQ